MTGDPLIRAAVLGVVEGITEFIPVSSTGHLIVVSQWLGETGERAKTFEIFIQLGAILAIVWLYRVRLLHAAVEAWRGGPGRRLAINLVLGFVPVAVVGLVAHDWIKERLFNPVVVAGALVVGGILILVLERWPRSTEVPDIDHVAPSTAFGVGLAQILSLIPGTSRSGATIMGGYALGLSRTAATEFSFFLSIPVMFAATIFDLKSSWHTLTAADFPAFAVGFVTAFVSALIVVRMFIGFVSRNSFAVFAWYRIAFGLLLLLLLR
ncbi:MAG TPA: undecaprenyl-diphosphate phosphatase [Gemmatimonadales bacterium]|jgi:undecaprenyl-diphosphatase